MSVQYPLIELVTALIWVAAVVRFGTSFDAMALGQFPAMSSPAAAAAAAFTGMFAAAAQIAALDFERHILERHHAGRVEAMNLFDLEQRLARSNDELARPTTSPEPVMSVLRPTYDA